MERRAGACVVEVAPARSPQATTSTVPNDTGTRRSGEVKEEKMETETQRGRMTAWGVSAAVAVVGVVGAGVSLSWLMASFGLSGIAAAQVVAAVEVGGAALALIGAMFSGGLAGAVISTIVWYLKRKLRRLAIR